MSRTVLPLILVVAGLLAGFDAHARTVGDLGFGLYQGANIRVTNLYPNLAYMMNDDLALNVGFNFSTLSSQNFGFLARLAYNFQQRGDADILLGATIEVAESGDTSVLFAPLVGVQYNIDNHFGIMLDGYPFMVSSDGSTEVFFLEARLGATYWF